MCRHFFRWLEHVEPYAADRLRPVRTPLRFGLFFRFRGAGNLSGVSVGATFGFPVRLHCLVVAMACPFHNDFHQTDLRIGTEKGDNPILAAFGGGCMRGSVFVERACDGGGFSK